jgi:hypothetical protein
MLTRRSYLKTSSLLALAPTVPVFVSRTARAAGADKDGRVLVVVQLDGGNDALNTLVPLKNETYAKLRPRLKIAEPIKLTDEFGLHPSFRQADKLIKAGQLLAIPGVGYPNPNRSHFESMAIWHTAKTDPEEYKGYGWLGRALDVAGGDSYTITNDVPRALRGRRSAAVSLTRLEDLTLADAGTVKNAAGPEAQQDLLAFVRRHAVDGTAAAEKMAALAKGSDGASYPGSTIGERLRLVADDREAGRPGDAARLQRVRPHDQGKRLGRDGPRHGGAYVPLWPESKGPGDRDAAEPDGLAGWRAEDDDRLPPSLRDDPGRLARREGGRPRRQLRANEAVCLIFTTKDTKGRHI